MNSIAFIGLGNMGAGMAANLVKKHYNVLAFDLSQAALDKAATNGCIITTSVREAITQANTVITMLPASQHVEQVYTNDVLPYANKNTLLIDCSTIDINTAKQVSQQAHQLGFSMLDAPVSGGTKAASAGTLTFMVGGALPDFEQAKGVLSAMGKKVIHAGESGAGQGAKICNNMLLGASMIATAESFQLAQKLGLDQQVFFDIASNASGQTWSMTQYCPVKGVGPESPADHNFSGGFASALMLKDLSLAMQGATSVDANVPMGELATALFKAHCERGSSQLDFSSIINSL